MLDPRAASDVGSVGVFLGDRRPAFDLRNISRRPASFQQNRQSAGDSLSVSTPPSPVAMSASRAALLIGKLAHARKEWQALSSLATLKVRLMRWGVASRY